MENKNIQDYRQPMVTATGIFLGFMLTFTAGWIREAFTVHKFRDTVVSISIIVCLSLLLTVLFRMLRIKYSNDVEFYRKTLLLFLIGITIPFIGFLIIIIERFVINVL